MTHIRKFVLAGNPNTGKTSLFNRLTGLNQRIGNYPGVTVDIKTGSLLPDRGNPLARAEITDTPGVYSLSARSEDEKAASQILMREEDETVVYVADATSLKRSLFLCTQIQDLGKGVVIALNMMDCAENKGTHVDAGLLSARLGVPVVPVNARTGRAVEGLKKVLFAVKAEKSSFMNGTAADPDISKGILKRYEKINGVLEGVVVQTEQKKRSWSQRIDRILTHSVFGFLIFFVLLFLMFQTLFTLAEYPMHWIEWIFMSVQIWLSGILPAGIVADLLVNGLLAGLSGIVSFVPQIALLFFFITLMEDTGYMARVIVLTDKVMRGIGLGGRSVVPMISGFACAVPAIMGTRTISSRKERIITILITPLMSCSARLPVYTLITALVVPPVTVAGVFNLRGVVFTMLYAAGILAAFAVALVAARVLKNSENQKFIVEIPDYRPPRLKNIFITIVEKCRVFIAGAGKVIIFISVILWFLASYGPLPEAERDITRQDEAEGRWLFAEAKSIESSYAAMIGRKMEPLISPLGYDWKIGIAILTSFAAREVFVGTMATIYSISDKENIIFLRDKMQREKRAETGEKLYTFATGLSLMLFYAFAMQCMSTLAVTYRETKSWLWPGIALIYMTLLAYLAAFSAYQIFK